MLLSLSHSYIVLAVCLDSWSCWKVSLCLRLRPLFSLRWSLYVDPFSCPSTLTIVPYANHWRTLPQPDAAAMVLGRWWVVHGFLQTKCFKLRLKNSISGLCDQRILFLTVWESFRWFPLQTPGGLSCVFEAFSWPLCIRHLCVISSHTSPFSLSGYPLPVFSMSFRGICLQFSDKVSLYFRGTSVVAATEKVQRQRAEVQSKYNKKKQKKKQHFIENIWEGKNSTSIKNVFFPLMERRSW